MRPSVTQAAIVAVITGCGLLAGCGGSGSATSAGGVAAGAAATTGTAATQSGKHHSGFGVGQSGVGYSASRAQALSAAAECIREHGIPGFADPVLTPGGVVYSDSRSIDDAPDSVNTAIQQACGPLLARAQFNPQYEPPAPPQLVQAGVASAECLRVNGMPNVADPSSHSSYTPGHGFGMTASEVPPGGKQSPIFQHAIHACQAEVDAEIRASTLASLGNDG